jgi:urease accessory protein
MAHVLQVGDRQTQAVSDAHPRPRLQAALDLEFQRDASGQTFLARSVQHSPLRVVRAFSVADGSVLAHLHNVSGGLLGGDDLAFSVDVGPAAQVQLTTTGSTRIYRPRADAPPAVQRNHIRVAEESLLEYVPDAIIPFAGSRFVQKTTVELAPGAGLFWWEIVAPGREARGEIFGYESFEMTLDLIAVGQLVAVERIRLEPRRQAVASLARLGRHRYWASFYICRVGVVAAEWLRIEQELRQTASQFTPAGALWGISTLPAHGLAVRCLARQGRDAVAGLHLLWNAAKQLLYNREAIRPRKVN